MRQTIQRIIERFPPQTSISELEKIIKKEIVGDYSISISYADDFSSYLNIAIHVTSAEEATRLKLTYA